MKQSLQQKRQQLFRINSQKSYDIEENLRAWGLLGHTAIQRTEDGAATRINITRKILWHRFRLLILWFLTIKLFYCCSLTNHSPYVYYLGDASGFMGVPKLEMGLMMALWTLPCPIVIFEFIKYKNTKPMQSWITIYDMFNSKLQGKSGATFAHNNIQKAMSEQQIRRRFRLRITQTRGLYWLLVLGAGATGGFGVVVVILTKWPPEYRRSVWALIWTVVSVFWIYYNQKSIKSCLIIFNQICYYITLRYRKINTNLEHLMDNWDKYHDTNHRRLYSLLREHDSITDLTLNSNKFWSLFIVTNTAIKIPLLLLAIHVTIFYDISFGGRVVAVFMTTSIFTYTTVIYFSAAQVEYASRKAYTDLNSMALKRMPVSLQFKLLNTIQRMDKRNIGFDIYAVHTISFLRYFEAIIASAIGFLLVVGLKFSDIKSLMTDDEE